MMIDPPIGELLEKVRDAYFSIRNFMRHPSAPAN